MVKGCSGLNRTYEELKPLRLLCRAHGFACLNRTYEELKLETRSLFPWRGGIVFESYL